MVTLVALKVDHCSVEERPKATVDGVAVKDVMAGGVASVRFKVKSNDSPPHSGSVLCPTIVELVIEPVKNEVLSPSGARNI